MKFLLQYENQWRERFYFAEAGEMHWSATLGAIRLIKRTCANVADAKLFDTAPEAASVLVEAGNPEGWTVLTVP